GALCTALSLNRLIVDANPGDAGVDAFTYQAADRHDATVTGITVDDHGGGSHTVCDPAGDLYAFGHRGGADICHASIAADHSAGTDEQRLTTRMLHDARQCC